MRITGKLADRDANYRTFAAILLFAALFTLAAGITSSPVLILIQSATKDIDDLVFGYANFYRLASHFNPASPPP